MNRVREEEIENILNNLNWNNSEDGADLSDVDDVPNSNEFFNHILDDDETLDIQNLPLEIVEDDGQVVPVPSTSFDFRPIQSTDSTTVGPTKLGPRRINRTPTINIQSTINNFRPLETVPQNISTIQNDNIVVPDVGQINVRGRPQVLTRPKELLNKKWKKGSFQKSETILHENIKLSNLKLEELQQEL